MSIDYAKLTVGEIKTMLVQEGRYTQEELEKLDVKGKTMWVNLHQNLDTGNEEFEFAQVVDDIDNLMDTVEPMEVPEVETDPAPVTPDYTDAGWSDYVLSLFSEDELVDGKYPNVNALRRVTELLLGEITFSGPIHTEQTMDPDHPGKAVVTYQVQIAWKLDQYYGTQDLAINVDLPVRTYQSVASVWIGNCDNKFAAFPESTAETRAEGRCLRRALRVNVVCADELTQKDTEAIVQQRQDSVDTTGEWEETGLITDQQINTITMMCERLGIDLQKFINSGAQEYANIGDVKRATAAGMLKQLNRFQSSGSESIEIPEELIGE